MKNIDKTSIERTNTFAENLENRATYPYVGSEEYLRQIAACEAAHKAQQARTSKAELASSFEIEPRTVALLFAIMLIIGAIFWVGCKAVDAIPTTLIAERADAIAKELAE